MVRRTKEDAQETRNRILDTAVEVLNRQGVAQTSLNDIAREAGVTRGAIYWHFANKVAMFDAMIERLLCPLLFNSADRDALLAADPLGFIRAAADEFIGKMLSDTSFRRVFEIFWHKCEYIGEMAALRDSHLEEGENHIDLIQRAFALAQEQGQMDRRLTPHQATIGFIGLVDGLLFNWTRKPGMFPLASYAPGILDAWFAGLGIGRGK
ncbi:MAG: TetR family transcriptional regulator [Dechloromonas sp.]|jgi:TetR/AcrR family acrAB operon transcriptional repressor|nr:TetR family transcriptional regulator [Dechloromonas sp.]MBN8462122.1 TetR family transcriptional regulator [Dechloromonas sp.]